MRVTVRGTPEAAQVAVVLREGERWRTLARGRAEAGVAVELPVAVDVPVPCELEAQALVPGLALLRRTFHAGDGGAVDVVLEPTEGGVLFGTVVDADGRPAAEVRLRVGKQPGPGPAGDVDEWDPGDGRLQATVRTDREGRFEVRGLAAGGFVIEAADARTWVEQADGGPAWVNVPGDAVALRIDPAYRITVRVEPASTHDDPASWGVVRWTLAYGSTSVDTSGPRLAQGFRGPLRTEAGQPLAFRVRVRTDLHATEERTFALTREQAEQSLTIPLRRLPDSMRGKVRVPLLVRSEGTAGIPLRATHMASEPGTPWASAEVHVPTTTEPDGSSVLTLPVGEQTLRLEPDLPYRYLLAWEIRVRVLGESEVTADVKAPTWAAARLLWREAAPPGPLDVEVWDMRGPGGMYTSESLKVVDGAVRIPALPEGTWLCTTKDANGKEWSVRFEIVGERPVEAVWGAGR